MGFRIPAAACAVYTYVVLVLKPKNSQGFFSHHTPELF